MANSRLCSIPDCGKARHKAGLCSAHSKRLMRNGTLEAKISPKGDKLQWLKDHLDYKGSECLIFPFRLNHKGRGQLQIDGKHVFAAVEMLTMKCGPRPTDRHEAAHSCGNGHIGCVHPQHLRWATIEENKADMVEHGTVMRGERNGNHKLTEHEAREILALKGLVSQRTLAARYSVNRSAVMLIHRGKNWKWLSE